MGSHTAREGLAAGEVRSSQEAMSNYTVTATIRVSSDSDRAKIQSLAEQGLRELAGVASRYGITLEETSITVDE